MRFGQNDTTILPKFDPVHPSDPIHHVVQYQQIQNEMVRSKRKNINMFSRKTPREDHNPYAKVRLCCAVFTKKKEFRLIFPCSISLLRVTT